MPNHHPFGLANPHTDCLLVEAPDYVYSLLVLQIIHLDCSPLLKGVPGSSHEPRPKLLILKQHSSSDDYVAVHIPRQSFIKDDLSGCELHKPAGYNQLLYRDEGEASQ